MSDTDSSFNSTDDERSFFETDQHLPENLIAFIQAENQQKAFVKNDIQFLF